MYFGPAGNSDRFYAEGNKSSLLAPQWLEKLGLNAYEYSFGRGVSITPQTAQKLGQKAQAHRIRLSAHAPYYINLANPDPLKRENSFRYILDSARILDLMGGERLVLHMGAVMKLERQKALDLCAQGLKQVYRQLDEAGLSHVHLCPETMGRYSQIGDLQETLKFCLMDSRLIPCVDFVHLHALSAGGLNTQADFEAVLDQAEQVLGIDRARDMHIHFSTIEFTEAGEKMHRTFSETKYGPRFELLGPLLRERKYRGTVICECRGTQADDAVHMMRIFTSTEKAV